MNIMKKLLLLLISIQLLVSSLYAQEIDVRVYGGTNLTFIPDFYSSFIIANDGLVVPGLIDFANSRGPITFSTSLSETNARFGLFFDIELGIKITEKLRLSFSSGLSQMKYTYNSVVHTEGAPDADLGKLFQNFGNTDLLYVNLKPVGISTNFLNNKVNLQFGFLFNFLVKSELNSTVIQYSNENGGSHTFENIDKVYFDTADKMNKVLYGINLQVFIKIIRDMDLFISGQYFFNSVYYNYKYGDQYLKGCRPFILQTGISWRLYNSGN